MATRDQVLARYRQLRAVHKVMQNEALSFISTPALKRSAKRLGMFSDDAFIAESDEEMTLIFDSALYDADQGRTRAIERYSRAKRPSAGSDEELVLDALCRTDFSLWCIERRHETAGLVLFDMLRDRESWFVDEGLEQSGPEGMTFAARMVAPEDFYMTTGVIVPLDELSVIDAASDPYVQRHETLDGLSADWRFVRAVYRAAVDNRTMEAVRFK